MLLSNLSTDPPCRGSAVCEADSLNPVLPVLALSSVPARGVGEYAGEVLEPADPIAAAATEALGAAGTLCRGADCTGARRTGRSLRGEPHRGAAPGVQGAACPGPENDAAGLAAGSCCGSALIGLAEGSTIDPVSPPASSSEPPCKTVAESVTADPTNSAPRVRAVGLRELGDADE